MENKARRIHTFSKFIEGVLRYFKVIDFAMPNIQFRFKLAHNFVSQLETLLNTTDVAGM